MNLGLATLRTTTRVVILTSQGSQVRDQWRGRRRGAWTQRRCIHRENKDLGADEQHHYEGAKQHALSRALK